jgi:hypothetical protein
LTGVVDFFSRSNSFQVAPGSCLSLASTSTFRFRLNILRRPMRHPFISLLRAGIAAGSI